MNLPYEYDPYLNDIDYIIEGLEKHEKLFYGHARMKDHVGMTLIEIRRMKNRGIDHDNSWYDAGNYSIKIGAFPESTPCSEIDAIKTYMFA
jgi:hypothetical protein